MNSGAYFESPVSESSAPRGLPPPVEQAVIVAMIVIAVAKPFSRASE
ncbi:hypothetical protein ALQ49_101300 [Pseudomonas syringae pv. apii]|uniref:Uncharacterized protein n=1 Tax=Pseudomonas syringae pv. apii TaxID=81036 RepID=A0A3M3RNZ6_9PSED|nr:hypothetical protein ALQ49_101300 [Pseudomonas syringae pv. apii]